jgi:hypothetical protein
VPAGSYDAEGFCFVQAPSAVAVADVCSRLQMIRPSRRKVAELLVCVSTEAEQLGRGSFT